MVETAVGNGTLVRAPSTTVTGGVERGGREEENPFSWRNETKHLGCSGVESLILRAEAMEMEKL